MPQVERTPETSPPRLGARRDNYLRWRQRLAAKQEALRQSGEDVTEPSANLMWSPDALFRADDEPTVVDDAPPTASRPAIAAESVPTGRGMDRSAAGPAPRSEAAAAAGSQVEGEDPDRGERAGVVTSVHAPHGDVATERIGPFPASIRPGPDAT